VPCFTECCGKLELPLTPYDVLRLKKRLDVSSSTFLDDYTEVKIETAHGFPEFSLRMDADKGKRCPFVTEQGCTVYEDRPGACRVYPLGRASTKNPVLGATQEFYFTVKESHCRGFEADRTWTVEEWLADQGTDPYNEFNDMLMELYLLRRSKPGAQLTERHIKMFVMAAYNTERFRDFVFKSGFTSKFAVPRDLIDKIATDDEELLRFALTWLKFALFGEPVFETARRTAS
jgi:Fe-S-cluster containining protein